MENNTVAAERKSDNGEHQSFEIWKQLPATFRNRLHEFTGAQLKVWIAYYCHSNAEGLAWASLKLLSEETGLSDDYIGATRGELIERGWLVPQGRFRRKDGTFSNGADKYLVVIPTNTTTGKSTGVDKRQRPKKSGTGKSRDTSTGKFTASSTGKSPVRSRSLEVDVYEVEPSNPLVGWMVSLLIENTYKVPSRTAEHERLVVSLEEKHGTEEVRRRFKAWLHRSAGFEGLDWPLLRFCQEWDTAGELAAALPEHLL